MFSHIKFLFFAFIFAVVSLATHSVLITVSAQLDCQNPSSITSNGDRDYCIAELERLKNLYLPAQETNKKNLAVLQSQLSDLNKRINALAIQLKNVAGNIANREEDLAFTKKIFEAKTSDHYKFLRTYDPLMPFLSSDTAANAFQEVILRQRAADEDRKSIDQYANDIEQLQKDKATLEKNKIDLASVQKAVNDKTTFLASEVAKVDAYLATLSAKQQSFLAQKLAALGISRSAYNLKGGCSDDRPVDPGFSPRIAFFTFGVPNRVGLNQFGAKGRAEAGQNYTQILQSYYNADVTSGYNSGINIHVSGTNEFGQSFDDTWNIEDYVKHLYEMPTDFPVEALKAQAIAARSYALAYTNNGGGSICPSQQCQVVKKEINNGTWQSAVDATRGVVLTSGGNPVKAWFSSTHGGYAFNSGDIGWSQTSWTKRMVDTVGGSAGSFSDLFNNAYDKSSPMFYCDWGGRSGYSNTAWLKPDELADIVNVWLLAKADGGTQTHLSQPDKPNPDGVDTWDAGRVKSELSSRGITPFNSISDVSIGADFGSGRTTNVHVNGDGGAKDISGDEFKNYFNLRAPANIQIIGPLFNVEKR